MSVAEPVALGNPCGGCLPYNQLWSQQARVYQ
jgi:hypothetical protein